MLYNLLLFGVPALAVITWLVIARWKVGPVAAPAHSPTGGGGGKSKFFCTNCGSPATSGAKFCAGCGSPL
jgi:hypothetical protein